MVKTEELKTVQSSKDGPQNMTSYLWSDLKPKYSPVMLWTDAGVVASSSPLFVARAGLR